MTNEDKYLQCLEMSEKCLEQLKESSRRLENIGRVMREGSIFKIRE